MPAATFSARDVAKAVAKATGKPVDAKRVRAWVRDHVASFDDEGYTAHVYDASLRARIVKGMTTAASKPRATAASKGRAKPVAKASTAPTGQKGRVSPTQPAMAPRETPQA